MGTTHWLEAQARKIRSVYWERLGDRARADAEPSPESLAAWCAVYLAAQAAD